MSDFTHVWRHRMWPCADFFGPRQQDLRVGQPCRVLAVGRNGPSADQVAWHAAERAAGGIVVVVWSVADLIRELKALGAPVT